MLLQEKQLSDFSPVHLNFADSLAGQSLIALLNVIVHFSERWHKDKKYFSMLYRFEPSFLQKPCVFLNLSPKPSDFEAFIAIVKG